MRLKIFPMPLNFPMPLKNLNTIENFSNAVEKLKQEFFFLNIV